MFENINRRRGDVSSTRWISTSLTMFAHVALAGAIVVVPLVSVGALPKPAEMMAFVAAPPPPPPPPPPPKAPPAAKEHPPETVPSATALPSPITPPTEIRPEPPSRVDSALAGAVGGVEGGEPGGVAGGVVGGIGTSAPPPPPPAPSEPVRVGGALKAPALLKRVAPEYPPMARVAQVQGTVVLEASVNASGHVEAAHVIQSVAMLDQSAIDAVKQWQYAPLRLNGTPTPFVLTVTLKFDLKGGVGT